MKRLLLGFLFFLVCSLYLVWQLRFGNQSILSFNAERAALQDRWAAVLGPGRLFPDLRLQQAGQDLKTAQAAAGRWTLYLFAPQPAESVLSYPLVLLERYRNLNLFCILPGAAALTQASLTLKPSGPSYRVLLDSHGELQSIFDGVGQGDFVGLTFADPQGVIRFSVPHALKPENMRQVVERFLLPQISYRLESDPKGLAPGAALPDLGLRRLSDGRLVRLAELAPDDATLIFFRAYCATCLVKPNVKRLQALIDRGVDFEEERIFLVFSKAHLPAEIQAFASSDPAWPEIYRAEDYVPGWEDPYNTIPDQRDPSTVIQISAGRISQSRSFFNWFLLRTGAM